MELEKQVCSLELAKKLKELGVKQESYWYWLQMTEGPRLFTLVEAVRLDPIFPYSAFTVAELGEVLGIHRGEPFRPQLADETEADHRAAHVIYLIENGLMKAEQEAA
jgi:hypothetical protein